MKITSLFTILLFSGSSFALNLTSYDSNTFEPWLNKQLSISQVKLIEAISRPDAAEGVVIASPSKEKPNYYYHWVRDAGLTMDVIVEMYNRTENQDLKIKLEQKIKKFINFSKKNQSADALTGLGEPKFYVDGTPYDLPWGRPQNDGPAIRAMALIKFANIKLEQGENEFVRQVLYDGKLPSHSVIKADLEYVALNWSRASFDLWEEVSGDHFFTLMVQRASMLEGAKLAQKLADFGASDWYLRQASKIEDKIRQFTNTRSFSYIPATLNYAGGMNTKKSNLDVAVILGLLRGNTHDNFISFANDRVLQTVNSLISVFQDIYSINKYSRIPGVAIGRYPEDVYDGDKFEGGNPWVLTTLAIAETYYELATLTAQSSERTREARAYFNLADEYFQRVQIHTNPDGSMSEQISRHNGYMTSAYDLTWNYSAVFTASWARVRAKSLLTDPL